MLEETNRSVALGDKASDKNMRLEDSQDEEQPNFEFAPSKPAVAVIDN